jgi:hypothetical protein
LSVRGVLSGRFRLQLHEGGFEHEVVVVMVVMVVGWSWDGGNELRRNKVGTGGWGTKESGMMLCGVEKHFEKGNVIAKNNKTAVITTKLKEKRKKMGVRRVCRSG